MLKWRLMAKRGDGKRTFFFAWGGTNDPRIYCSCDNYAIYRTGAKNYGMIVTIVLPVTKD